jgi:hypothetical protein
MVNDKCMSTVSVSFKLCEVFEPTFKPLHKILFRIVLTVLQQYFSLVDFATIHPQLL